MKETPTEFKSFLKEKREQLKPKPLVNDPDVKKIIEEHLMLTTVLSENALVSLIMNVNGGELNKSYVRELELFGYVTEGTITAKGTDFINSEDTIERLKTIVG